VGITKYNSIPLVRKVNPDLTDLCNESSIMGFKMVAVRERNIRTNLAQNLCFITKSFHFAGQRYNSSYSAHKTI
jgi:hypothetical protein